MAASRADIENWFDRGVKAKNTYLIVVCDTFDHDDYPVYVGKGEDFYEVYDRYSGGQNMQRVMEVYDLSCDKTSQMNEHRAFHMPPRPAQRTGAEP